jgi:hypothetical protein
MVTPSKVDGLWPLSPFMRSAGKAPRWQQWMPLGQFGHRENKILGLKYIWFDFVIIESACHSQL